MKVTNVALILALIVAACVGCGLNGHQVEMGGGYVQGVVSESETSQPIDSVLMRLAIDASGNTAAFDDVFTDSTGHYVLYSGVRAGKLYVVAMKDGYVKVIKEVNIIRRDTAVVDYELEDE
jgi:hypothetical protein